MTWANLSPNDGPIVDDEWGPTDMQNLAMRVAGVATLIAAAGFGAYWLRAGVLDDFSLERQAFLRFFSDAGG